MSMKRKCRIKACPYFNRAEVPFGGPLGAEMVVVGESPGMQEMMHGKPFIGASGKVLDAVLESIGYPRSQVRVLNSCRCHINKDDDPIKMQNLALKTCRTYLTQAIQKAAPKVIVCLGAVALQQVLGMKKLMENRGRFFDSKEFGCKVFVTVHPAYVLRGSSPRFWEKPEQQRSMKENLLFMDFQQVVKYLKTGQSDSLKIADTYREATMQDVLGLYQHKVVAVDFETTGLNLFDPALKTLSVSMCGEEGKAFVVFAKDGKLPRYVLKFLSSSIPKIVANRPYDESVCKLKLGITMGGVIHDVFTMAHLLDENYMKYSLESIADIYTPLKGIKSLAQGMRGQLGKLKKSKLLKYSGVDADATLRAFNVMKRMLRQDKKLARYYLSFILPIQNMFTKIYTNPGLISTRQLRKDQRELETLVDELHSQAMAMIPEVIVRKYTAPKTAKSKVRKISLRSAALIRDHLFSHHAGLRLTPNKDKKYKTKKGGLPSTNAKHLRQFHDVPFIETFLRMRKADKVLRTYLRKYWRAIKDGKTGLIYPSTLLYNTVTGRTVMKEPTIQTVPQRGEFAPYAKRCFVVPSGWLFGARDLGQSEIRIMGWIANDPNILGALRRGIDIHTMTAAIVNNVPIEEVTKDMRQKAKGVNFGFLYGMSAHSFRTYAKDEYGVSFTEAECEAIREKFFAAPKGYHMLPTYHKLQAARALKQGYVRSPLGRLRRLALAFSGDQKERANASRQAINMPIQSFSSDLGLIGMMLFQREVERRGLEDQIKVLWFIHDSVIFMAKTAIMPLAMEILKECMEQRSKMYIERFFSVKIGYPITSDGKVGRSWATLSDYCDKCGKVVGKGRCEKCNKERKVAA